MLKLSGAGTVEGNGRIYPITMGYESAEQAIAASGLITVPHGLGVSPKSVELVAVCKTADSGYAVGDIIMVGAGLFGGSEQGGRGLAVWLDAINVYIRVHSSGFASYPHKSTGASVALTAANWRLVVRAFT